MESDPVNADGPVTKGFVCMSHSVQSYEHVNTRHNQRTDQQSWCILRIPTDR